MGELLQGGAPVRTGCTHRLRWIFRQVQLQGRPRDGARIGLTTCLPIGRFRQQKDQELLPGNSGSSQAKRKLCIKFVKANLYTTIIFLNLFPSYRNLCSNLKVLGLQNKAFHWSKLSFILFYRIGDENGHLLNF